METSLPGMALTVNAKGLKAENSHLLSTPYLAPDHARIAPLQAVVHCPGPAPPRPNRHHPLAPGPAHLPHPGLRSTQCPGPAPLRSAPSPPHPSLRTTSPPPPAWSRRPRCPRPGPASPGRKGPAPRPRGADHASTLASGWSLGSCGGSTGSALGRAWRPRRILLPW